MKLRVVTLLAAILGAAGTVSAATVTTDTLSNGLRVHIHADADLPLTQVDMFFAAGRANDPDSLAGLAHLAEHMLTESSPAYPDGGLIRRSTLYATYRNAVTGGSFMKFDTQCLPEFLPQVLELEVERLRGSGLDETSFAREKAVVLEELAFRHRLSAWSAHVEGLFQTAYAGHPLGQDVGGSAETVDRITLTDFEAFRARNILPHRAALVISGPVDPDSTLVLVRRLFTSGPAAAPEHLDLPALPSRRPVQLTTDSPDFDGVRVSVGCRVPLHDVRDAVLASHLVRLLGIERGGAGLMSVPGEAFLHLSAQSPYDRPPTDPQKHYGYLYQAFDPDQTAQRTLAYMWSRVDAALDDLADETAFAERRQAVLAAAEDFDVGAALVNGNVVPTADDVRTVLDALTAAEFAAFAAAALTSDNAVVVVSHGRDSEREQAIALARRRGENETAGGSDALAGLTAVEIAPVLAAYARADLRSVVRTELANGVPLLYLELPDKGDVRLGGCRVLPPLKIQRPGDKAGIAHLYDILVDYDDRQRRDPDDRNYRLRRLKYDLNLSLEPGLLTYGADGPGDKIRQVALEMVRRLDSREFNQERWFRLTRSGRGRLADLAVEPTRRATAWRLERVLGPAWYDLGWYRPEAESMERIRHKDLVKVHREVARDTDQTVLFGAGNLPAQDVHAAVDMAFGRRGRYRALVIDAPALEFEGVTGRVFPDLARGDVLLTVTFPAVAAAPPDGIETLLLETALDQVLTARLREIEGLTYAVWARAMPLSGTTLWEVSVTCQPGQGPLVLEALRDQVRGIQDGGFTADELARARLGLTGRMIRAYSDRDRCFALLRRLGAFALPAGDPLDAVAAVEDSRLNELAVGVLDTDRLVFTAVGPVFEDELERFRTD